MSIKGFPSSQKLPLGTGISNDFVTVQPMGPHKNALDVTKAAFRVGGLKTAAANTGNIDGLSWVYDTATVAKAGDFIRFESGSNQYVEAAIVKVEANRFLLGALLTPAPSAGDTFYIMKYVTQQLDSDGNVPISVTSPPIQFVLDGTPTDVERDTVTPANSNPLPIVQLDATGNIADSATLSEQQTQSGILQDISDQQLGVADAGNTSIAPLGIGGVFTGVSVDIKDYSAICVAVASDVGSATNGLSMQFSPDGTNWDHKHEFTVGVNGVSFTQAAELRYFRVVYTNGAVAQTYFRLTTILKRQQTSPSRYTVEQPLFGGQMADVTKSVIWGLSTSGGGGYYAVKVNGSSGSLATETTLAGLDAAVLGQETMANSLPVVLPSDQTVAVSAATLPLPTGAATDDAEGSVAGGAAGTKSLLAGGVYNIVAPSLNNGEQAALQFDSSGNLKTVGSISGTTTNTQGNKGTVVESWYVQLTDGTANGVKVTDGAVGSSDFALAVGLHPDSPLPAGTNNIGDVDVLSLPVAFNAGASGANTQRIVIASDQAPTTVGQSWFNKITDGTNTAAVKAASTAPVAADPALVVTMSPNSVAAPQAGRNKVQQLFNDYSVTSVTTAAYTQLTASSTAAANKIEIFDSSGEALILAVGGAGSEVDQLYIFPGGNGAVDLAIPAGSRISVKAKTATASAGFLAINLYS